MTLNPLVQLGALGQSPWYDFITRDLVISGELHRLIAEDGLMGMTSNPTIFEKAVARTRLYDDDIRRLTEEGKSPAESLEAIMVADVQVACDVFRPLYYDTDGVDGLVSLEVPPALASDTEGTVAEAERLWRALDRPNAMIKIPGTSAGLPAITECLAQGINVNVTLLFSVERYGQVIAAFLEGLERRALTGLRLDQIASVASFFVSRVDSKVDPMLDLKGDPHHLRGTAAIANACTAYALFQRSLQTPLWKRLVEAGAHPQRPLWASTSTKDPGYADVHYVEALIAPHTVNTMPPETFAAYRDHGKPAGRIIDGMAAAPSQLTALAEVGIDLVKVTHELEEEGVGKFAASYTSLLERIEAKAGELEAAP